MEYKLLKFYQEEFKKLSLRPVRFEGKDDFLPKNSMVSSQHAAWMIDEMVRFMEESQKWTVQDALKVSRWIGFVQGVLWQNNIFTIDELRQHVIHSKEAQKPPSAPTPNTVATAGK
jgi:hypothetical protein